MQVWCAGRTASNWPWGRPIWSTTAVTRCVPAISTWTSWPGIRNRHPRTTISPRCCWRPVTGSGLRNTRAGQWPWAAISARSMPRLSNPFWDRHSNARHGCGSETQRKMEPCSQAAALAVIVDQGFAVAVVVADEETAVDPAAHGDGEVELVADLGRFVTLAGTQVDLRPVVQVQMCGDLHIAQIGLDILVLVAKIDHVPHFHRP